MFLLDKVIVVPFVSNIERIGCQSEITTLHGGQSRSWFAEPQKEHIKIMSGTPPRCSYRENIIKLTHRARTTKRRKKKMPRRASRDASSCLGATQVSMRLAPLQDSFGASHRLG